jgi:hypothetical protein
MVVAFDGTPKLTERCIGSFERLNAVAAVIVGGVLQVASGGLERPYRGVNSRMRFKSGGRLLLPRSSPIRLSQRKL